MILKTPLLLAVSSITSNKTVAIREENFLHLLGLHKVVDIQLIQFWLDRTNRTVKLMDVIKGIKNGTLTVIFPIAFRGSIKKKYAVNFHE